MIAERLALAAWVVVWLAVSLSLITIVWVLVRNHRDRRRHDRETEHERLTDEHF